MRHKIKLLILLLLIQLDLIAYVYQDKIFESDVQQKKVFLELDVSQIDKVEVYTGLNKPIVIKKHNNTWVLPGYKNLPVAKGVVDGLMLKLMQEKVSTPVAVSKQASRRFSVNKNKFKRKLALYKNNKILAQVLIGESAAYQTHYARIEKDNRIYTIKINMDSLPAEQKKWFNHQIIQPVLPIAYLESADFLLENTEGQWQLRNTAGNEQLNQKQVTRLLNYIKFIQVIDVADAIEEIKKPSFYFIVKDNQGRVRYDFYHKDNITIVKSSRSALYFQLADYLARNLEKLNKQSLTDLNK